MAKNFLSGIGQAIAVVFLLSGLGLTLWNEYRTVRVALMLNKAEKELVEADASGTPDRLSGPYKDNNQQEITWTLRRVSSWC